MLVRDATRAQSMDNGGWDVAVFAQQTRSSLRPQISRIITTGSVTSQLVGPLLQIGSHVESILVRQLEHGLRMCRPRVYCSRV